MGANLIKRKLAADSFLNRNLLAKTNTVFPSTTTAATSAIRNGRPPCENGWLGWSQYLKEADDIIIPFRSMGFYNDVCYEKDIFKRYVPIPTTEEELNKAGIEARILFPSFEEDGCEDFDEMCCRLADFSYSISMPIGTSTIPICMNTDLLTRSVIPISNTSITRSKIW